MLKIFYIFITGLVCSIHANAQIYQWVDEQGVTHFSSRPPQGMAIEAPQTDTAGNSQTEKTDEAQPAEPSPPPTETTQAPSTATPNLNYGNHALELRSLLTRRRFAALNEVLSYYHQRALENPEAEQQLEQLYSSFEYDGSTVERLLAAWVAATPDRIEPYLAFTRYYYHKAWNARGTRSAADTTSEQFAQMRHYLDLSKAKVQQAQEIRQDHPLIYSNLVSIANATGDRLSASSAVRAAIDWQPATYSARSAYLTHLQPKWGGSIKDMQAFINEAQVHQVANPRLTRLQGYIAMDQAERQAMQRQDQEVIALYSQALGFGAHHHWYAMRGRAYSREGQFANAFRDFDQAIAAHPGKGDYYYRRAASYLMIDDAAERQQALTRYQRFNNHAGFDYSNPALADVQRAISHDPGEYNYYKLVDHLLSHQQNWPQLIEYWNQYIARNPTDSRAYFERGGTHYHSGNQEQALSDLRRAIDLGHVEAPGVYQQLAP